MRDYCREFVECFLSCYLEKATKKSPNFDVIGDKLLKKNNSNKSGLMIRATNLRFELRRIIKVRVLLNSISAFVEKHFNVDNLISFQISQMKLCHKSSVCRSEWRTHAKLWRTQHNAYTHTHTYRRRSETTQIFILFSSLASRHRGSV